MSYWSTPEALADVSPRNCRWPEGFDVMERVRQLGGNDVTVLDFGCGDGRLAEAFNENRYIGVDINPYAVTRCAQLYPRRTFKIARRPLPRADVALCYTVLLHVPDEELQSIIDSLVEAASRVVVVEILGTKWRREGGTPPCFNRELSDYESAFEKSGMYLYALAQEPYLRYGGVDISFMDFRIAR